MSGTELHPAKPLVQDLRSDPGNSSAQSAASGATERRTHSRLPAAFEDSWRELCDVAGGAIEQWDWIQACAQMNDRLVSTNLVEANGACRAFAAFEAVRRRGVVRREMLGVLAHYEPTEFVAATPEDLEHLCREVASGRQAIRCGRIPAGSPTITGLRDAYRKRGLFRESPEAAAPWIALDDTWRSPESHLNSGRRSDLRRARKRADEAGRVEFQILAPRPSELTHLLDEAFAVEGKSWKGETGTALACDAQRGEFFRRYCESTCHEGTLRLAFLRIDGKAVAMQIAVIQSRRFWLLKVGYDAAYSRCSPGQLLTRETIAYAAEQRLLTFEFLGRCEAWTDLWTSLRRECVSIVAYPWTLSGMAAFTVDGAAHLGTRGSAVARAMLQKARGALRHAVRWTVGLAAKRYITGDTLEAAVRVREGIAHPIETTLGFWDGEGDAPREVAQQYLSALETMRGRKQDAYLSIKLPSLGFSKELLHEVAAKAAEVGARLHFDALGPESVDATQSAIEDLQQRFPELTIGFTLAARWKRSVTDADWAVKQKVAVRVVKGQFSDPAGDCEPRRGFLNVVARLSGRARHVDVATHDEALAREAELILEASRTSYDREVLFGLGRPERLARTTVAPVRVYLPYGAAYLPYAVAKLRQNPGIAVRLVVDSAKSVVGL